VETTELFVPFLEEHGFSVHIEDSPRIYADVDYMPMVDPIIQSVSRSTIEMQQFDGLRAAVEAGAGMAGWHGGITRQWGNGRIFVVTPGHRVEVLEDPNVRTIIERGLLWAARRR
jgi:type 1 glutamine amidotransferase